MTDHFIWKNPEYEKEMFAGTSRNPVYAVIAAAGSGSRMGLPGNKQFLAINGVPVIVRSLRILNSIDAISGMVVVASADECTAMQDLLSDCRFPRLMAITAGGSSRQASVANGLETLKMLADPARDSPVLVHDGARCFVPQAVVERVISGIQEHQACGAAVPVKDTIKIADATGRVVTTPERNRLWAMQTPQGALWHLLYASYQLAVARSYQATDDLVVLEQAGHPAFLVMGDYGNIKITTQEDLQVSNWLASRQDESGSGSVR
ncbi:MAG: 2-C-methyl-D-erythritol 4-phosphate cytidylyltransferase [Bacillota bacterium]|nr:2-C-methyl-D-erythritol 4-phosphate cytidylyltransferase [Bacillota bacterium]